MLLFLLIFLYFVILLYCSIHMTHKYQLQMDLPTGDASQMIERWQNDPHQESQASVKARHCQPVGISTDLKRMIFNVYFCQSSKYNERWDKKTMEHLNIFRVFHVLEHANIPPDYGIDCSKQTVYVLFVNLLYFVFSFIRLCIEQNNGERER